MRRRRRRRKRKSGGRGLEHSEQRWITVEDGGQRRQGLGGVSLFRVALGFLNSSLSPPSLI
ncbi:unnamed protein product [Arabidopsis halleri]